MKPKLLHAFAIALFVIGCKQPNSSKKPIDSVKTKPVAIDITAKQNNKDTLFITTQCVVRIDLDTIQLDKLRKKYGDDAFYTGADDNAYYSSVVDSVIKANYLLQVGNRGQKFVKFIDKSKVVKQINTDTLPQPANYYFFKPGKPVYVPDITMIEDEYKSYFKK